MILIVEDNAADSQLLSRAFEKAGLGGNIVRVKDGDQAVAYLDGTDPYSNREANPMPSMVLLDIKLPRRSGFEVLSWIRRDSRPLRRIPVMILTSSQHAVDINRAYELGANAYTVKSDTTAELTTLVDSVKKFWMGFNHFPLVNTAGETGGRDASGKTRASGKVVLLIEDERTDAMLIARAFHRSGFPGAVEHAPDAVSALRWLDARIASGREDALPGVVLLDLKLPGMSGLDLLDAIRERPALRSVPVVVLTGAHDSRSVNQAYERGANSYLVKSAKAEDIERLIHFVQQYWLTVNSSSMVLQS